MFLGLCPLCFLLTARNYLEPTKFPELYVFTCPRRYASRKFINDWIFFFFLMLQRYLHEVCRPPVIHQNFRSANLLLDDKLEVHVSGCGLSPLLASASVSQVVLFLRVAKWREDYFWELNFKSDL